MQTTLNDFPYFKLISHPTRTYKLEKLSKHLGANIYIKRDDTDFLGGGGNKLRKLEFLLGDAINKRCDRIITLGALQSNHARLTAAACNYAGLTCDLILGKTVLRSDTDYLSNGNLLLDKILDVNIHKPDAGVDLIRYAADFGESLAEKGHRPYIIPFGGSNPIGALGYVKCASEIKQQEQEIGVVFNKIVLVNGSSGTHAGTVAGVKLFGLNALVHGYNVVRHNEKSFNLTYEHAFAAINLFKNPAVSLTHADIIMYDDFLGSAYGQPTDAAIAAIKLLAKTEGIFLDPVYTAKAFAGLINGLETGKYDKCENILFLMTGGSPALYAYKNIF
jgi:L-cysteate sulfo-lyase